MGTFRQNPITKEWTIISPNRKKRPGNIGVADLGKKVKRNPFEPGNEKETPPEVFRIGPGEPDTPGWEVRVIPNKYPIVSHHEIIIHSPDPKKDIEDLPIDQVAKILQAYLARFKTYYSAGYTHIFCNHGKDSGASLKHPHSQLVVLDHIPEAVMEELLGAQDFYQQRNLDPYGEEIKKARANKKRLVYENSSMVVITPYASQWPYETMIFPKQKEDSFANISGNEIKDLARALQRVLKALKSIFGKSQGGRGDFSYNYWLQSSNSFLSNKYPGVKVPEIYRWHFEIIPRIKKLGGIELGAEVMVVDRDTPEVAAKQLRRVISEMHYH